MQRLHAGARLHVGAALHLATTRGALKRYSTRAEHTPCLIELCAHTVERDIRTLFAQPQVAAEALAEGLADYLGIAPPVDYKALWEAEKTRREVAEAALGRTRTAVAQARDLLAAALG